MAGQHAAPRYRWYLEWRFRRHMLKKLNSGAQAPVAAPARHGTRPPWPGARPAPIGVPADSGRGEHPYLRHLSPEAARSTMPLSALIAVTRPEIALPTEVRRSAFRRLMDAIREAALCGAWRASPRSWSPG